MQYSIEYSEDAYTDLFRLRAFDRAAAKAEIEKHLRFEPMKESKSRIKQLRELISPQYRLRIGDDLRVFYDVAGDVVKIHGIVEKDEVDQWLLRFGVWP